MVFSCDNMLTVKTVFYMRSMEGILSSDLNSFDLKVLNMEVDGDLGEDEGMGRKRPGQDLTGKDNLPVRSFR